MLLRVFFLQFFRVVYEASTLLHKIVEGPEFANDRNEMIPSMLEDSSILTLFLLKWEFWIFYIHAHEEL